MPFFLQLIYFLGLIGGTLLSPGPRVGRGSTTPPFATIGASRWLPEESLTEWSNPFMRNGAPNEQGVQDHPNWIRPLRMNQNPQGLLTDPNGMGSLFLNGEPTLLPDPDIAVQLPQLPDVDLPYVNLDITDIDLPPISYENLDITDIDLSSISYVNIDITDIGLPYLPYMSLLPNPLPKADPNELRLEKAVNAQKARYKKVQKQIIEKVISRLREAGLIIEEDQKKQISGEVKYILEDADPEDNLDNKFQKYKDFKSCLGKQDKGERDLFPKILDRIKIQLASTFPNINFEQLFPDIYF